MRALGQAFTLASGRAPSNEKGINSTWHQKFCRADMAKQPMSSGKVSTLLTFCKILMSHLSDISLGMTMLETASNIVVPDQ